MPLRALFTYLARHRDLVGPARAGGGVDQRVPDLDVRSRGSTDLSRVRQILYGIIFVLYVMAAVSFLFVPSPAVSQQGDTILTLWHGFLGVGGVVSAVGVILRKKFIEIAGLPLLCSALLAYVVSLVDTLIKAHTINGPAIGIGCIILAGMLALVDRGLSLRGWIRLADSLNEKYSDEANEATDAEEA